MPAFGGAVHHRAWALAMRTTHARKIDRARTDPPVGLYVVTRAKPYRDSRYTLR